MERRWLTVRETAKYLNLHIKSVYRSCSQQKIPHSKVPGIGIRVDKKRLDEKIESSEIEPQGWA